MEFLSKYSNVVHWLPRISLAAIFIYHGFTKFPMADMMAKMMGMPIMMVYLLALMELTAGVFIIVGGAGRETLTRIGGLIIATIMAGAIMMVHINFGWNGVLVPGVIVDGKVMAQQGVELQLFILTMGLYFAVKGNDAN